MITLEKSTQKNLTETQKIIAGQLLQSTGESLCDSGSAYGRHWESNQKNGISFNRDVDMEYITIPIATYLDHMLEYDETCAEIEKALGYPGGIPFGEDIVYKGPFPEGITIEGLNNSYNWDNDLSQNIQFAFIEREGDPDKYILLSVHQGCDIRGGYSDYRVYLLKDPGYFLMGQSVEFTDPRDPSGNPLSSYEGEQNSYWDPETKSRYWEKEFYDGEDREVQYYCMGTMGF